MAVSLSVCWRDCLFLIVVCVFVENPAGGELCSFIPFSHNGLYDLSSCQNCSSLDCCDFSIIVEDGVFVCLCVYVCQSVCLIVCIHIEQTLKDDFRYPVLSSQSPSYSLESGCLTRPQVWQLCPGELANQFLESACLHSHCWDYRLPWLDLVCVCVIVFEYGSCGELWVSRSPCFKRQLSKNDTHCHMGSYTYTWTPLKRWKQEVC